VYFNGNRFWTNYTGDGSVFPQCDAGFAFNSLDEVESFAIEQGFGASSTGNPLDTTGGFGSEASAEVLDLFIVSLSEVLTTFDPDLFQVILTGGFIAFTVGISGGFLYKAVNRAKG